MLSVHFQVAGDFLLGDMRLCFPYVVLEPFLGGFEDGTGARLRMQPGSMREVLMKSVAPAGVDFAVELGGAKIPLRQLMTLRRGDVVPLNTRAGAPLVAPVQGVPKFEGQVGTRGNRLAFRVGRVLEHGDG
jgi:flagellar motor switch protein FliM